jgi:hypothetical protein
MITHEAILLAATMAIIQNAQPYKIGLQLLKLDKVYLLVCTLCSTFWVGMLYFGLQDVTWQQQIGMSALSALLAEFVDRELNKY